MNALIIEDEQLAADRLIAMIEKSGQQINILDQFDTVRDTVDYLQNKQEEVDILFCDIQLADGLSFSIFEKINVKTPVVFTTAYDEYSLKAFKVNSIDYLLKPVQQDELNDALDKYQSLYSDRSNSIDFSKLKELFEHKKQYKERFLVKSGSKYYNKPVAEITYFSSDNKIVYLHDGESSKKYMTDYTLDELMKNHLDDKRFFRINRQFIVHINAITLMKPYTNQRLILQLSSGQVDELIVSREKVANFKEWFK
ncbi:MAG: LytTR family DNA-binding domain-containing protein [Bacteroidota bacterium]